MRAVVLSHCFADPEHRQKLKELAALGWSLTVALPRGRAGTDGALRLVPIGTAGDPETPATLRWNPRTIRRLLTDVRPALVYAEEEPGTHGAYVALREGHRLGIPGVVYARTSLPVTRSLFERRRYARTLRLAAGAVGINASATGLLRQTAPDLATLVVPQTGVTAPTSPQRLPHDGLTMAFVGRLVPERGADRLLRACGQLMGPWTLSLVGTGPEQVALEDLAQRLGLASRLRWLGALSREQVTALWPEIDCLVVPSRATPDWVESWSPVLVDAMAHGVASVVSAEGALPEVVREGGVVFADDEELLVALQQLLTDPDRRRALGDAGRRRVLEHYQDASLARALDGFWRSVVAARTPVGA